MGLHTMNDIGPFPTFDIARAQERVAQILGSRSLWRNGGKFCEHVEKAFADKCGVDRGILTTNGSHALEAAIATIIKPPGSEIIIPALSFIAVANSVLSRGYIPVPVDIDSSSWNLDPLLIEGAITEKTAAILAVHFAGAPCDMTLLKKIVPPGIDIVEDAAQAHFAHHDGKPVGSFGQIGCFSFQAAKTMTCGEGGIVVTNDLVRHDFLEAFINYGRGPTDRGYGHAFHTSNFRMSELQAAVLVDQLERIDEENMVRQLRFDMFMEIMAQRAPAVRLQAPGIGTTRHGHSLVPLLIPENIGSSITQKLISELQKRGWPVRPAYPLLCNTGVLDSCLERRILNQSEVARIRDAEALCSVAADASRRMIVFNHATLYRTRAELDELAGILGEAICSI